MVLQQLLSYTSLEQIKTNHYILLYIGITYSMLPVVFLWVLASFTATAIQIVRYTDALQKGCQPNIVVTFDDIIRSCSFSAIFFKFKSWRKQTGITLSFEPFLSFKSIF